MIDAVTGDDHRVDTLVCPVVDEAVTVAATFKRSGPGRRLLVDFGCNLDGNCGIPTWDPCPLYITYLEKSFIRKRI